MAVLQSVGLSRSQPKGAGICYTRDRAIVCSHEDLMYLPIGSISSGTLQVRDLAQAYCQALEHFQQMFAWNRPDDFEAVRKSLDHVKSLLDTNDEEGLTAFVADEAPELFNPHCAPFTYFGSHPGDGADIGVWPDIDGLENAARYRDGVVKVNAGEPWPELDKDIAYVFEVNDHGNCALFCAHTHERLWDVV